MECNPMKSAASAVYTAGPRAALFRSNKVGAAGNNDDRNIHKSGAGVGWGFTVGGIACGHARNVAGASVGNVIDYDIEDEVQNSQRTKSKRK